MKMKLTKKGFTLIELLVVIAIIAILAAILFPVFARARAAARRITGISNLNQLGKAMLMYTQDYDEQFNHWNWGTDSCDNAGTTIGKQRSGTFFSNATQPYVKSIQVFQDPSDTKQWGEGYCAFPNDGRNCGQSTYNSYGVNENLQDGGGAGWNKMAKYQYPAQDLMLADGASTLIDTWQRFGWTDDLYIRRAIWTEDWINEQGSNAQADVTEPKWSALMKYNRHGGIGTNVSFVDGHAKLVTLRGMREVGPDVGQIVPAAGSVIPKW